MSYTFIERRRIGNQLDWQYLLLRDIKDMTPWDKVKTFNLDYVKCNERQLIQYIDEISNLKLDNRNIIPTQGSYSSYPYRIGLGVPSNSLVLLYEVVDEVNVNNEVLGYMVYNALIERLEVYTIGKLWVDRYTKAVGNCVFTHDSFNIGIQTTRVLPRVTIDAERFNVLAHALEPQYRFSYNGFIFSYSDSAFNFGDGWHIFLANESNPPKITPKIPHKILGIQVVELLNVAAKCRYTVITEQLYQEKQEYFELLSKKLNIKTHEIDADNLNKIIAKLELVGQSKPLILVVKDQR